MRIMYLTQWFDPEPGVIKGPAFVKGLEEAGHQVTVVTGIPNYPTGKVYPGYKVRVLQQEQLARCKIERIPLYPSHSASSVGRAINFLSFFASAMIYGLLRGGRYDLIYVYHPPITVGLAAALFGWVRRKRFILEVQDLWPDTLLATGMRGAGRVVGAIGRLCNFVYRRAEHVIVQSEGMRTLLIERGVPEAKLTVIRNPADDAALGRPEPASRASLGVGTGFTLVYGGNLGAAQAMETAIRAAQLARERGARFEFLLIGHGIETERLKALARSLGADHVHFRPPVAKEQINAVFQAADALFMQIADEPLFQITIPSKTQFYLASGRAIVAGIAGETAGMLRESGAAIVVPPGDVEAMAEAMIAISSTTQGDLDKMGRRGFEYYSRTFSYQTMVRSTLRVIERAAGR